VLDAKKALQAQGMRIAAMAVDRAPRRFDLLRMAIAASCNKKPAPRRRFFYPPPSAA